MRAWRKSTLQTAAAHYKAILDRLWAGCGGCHAIIITPERRARLRLSHSWSLLGQSEAIYSYPNRILIISRNDALDACASSLVSAPCSSSKVVKW